MDYFNGTFPDHTISLAIVKLPAKVAIDDPRYGGPILINPGGPGGPGASFAAIAGRAIQTFVDPALDPASAGDDARFFDIIGFDPRGIGETEPAAACISDPAAAWAWRLREGEEGILGSSDAALGRLWSMTHAFGSSCGMAVEAQDGSDIKRYMTTAFVARDMLEIVEKHAEYVAHKVSQASHNMGKRAGCHRTSRTNYEAGKAKLQYWGFSYGTILGSTFASMFPDRLGRVVLDGVVNTWDYDRSLGNGSLVDNEKAMESFYSYCLLSGPETCPLATGNATSATSTAAIKERTEKILQSLYHSPLMLASADGPEVVTYSDIKSIIFSSIYQPLYMFKLLARLLSEIELGRGEFLDSFAEIFRQTHTLSCGINGTVTTAGPAAGDVPTLAVLCADGIEVQDTTLEDFTEYWHLLRNMSTAAGDIWSTLRLKCASWTIRANYRFEGEFGGNTSHPILFVSNTADPVTPLRSGRIMHARFPESALLINDQAGHCSFSAKNLCAFGKIRQYFQTGDLPNDNTLCVPPPSAFSLNSTDPTSPFYDPTLEISNPLVADVSIDAAQHTMHEALETVQRVVTESDIFGFSGLIGNKRAASVQRLAALRHID